MPEPIRSRPPRGAAQRVRTGARTLLACISCKERKLRCDDQVPSCANCRRNGIVCLVEDPATKRHQPRNYLETLEQRIAFLEGLLQEVSSHTSSDLGPSPGRELVEDHQEVSDLSSMIGTLSLNAAGAEPHYLGPSSVFAFARFIKPSLHQVVSSIPPEVSYQESDATDMLSPEPCPLPDYHTAVRLSNAYFQNIHPQYPFLHEPTFRLWETMLEDPFEAMNLPHYKPVPLYFLNMVYAVGALLLPNLGYSAEQLYVSALLYIDDILCHDNLESIQAILCAATYSLRSSKGTSHWKLAGQALRQCINLGYHRNQIGLGLTSKPLQVEMQKRTFWSAYVMECSAAVMLGRPLSLHFEEIDVEFPLDTEDSAIPETGICASRRSPTDPPTMMTHTIHAFRIRILHGCIQTQLYSDNTLRDPETRSSRIQKLLTELDKWQGSNPPPMVPPPGGALSFFLTPDWYQVSQNYAILQIYRVQITNLKQPAPDDIYLKCLEAAESTCHCYRRQFFGKPTTYTWGALHDLFVAGLTYLYCLWTSSAARDSSRQDQVSSTCTDCTMVLVILAERWPEAAPFRDLFEALASRTMTMMANKQQQQQEPATSTALITWQEQFPEDLPQWMAGITDSGMSLGADWLLSGLIDDFQTLEQQRQASMAMR